MSKVVVGGMVNGGGIKTRVSSPHIDIIESNPLLPNGNGATSIGIVSLFGLPSQKGPTSKSNPGFGLCKTFTE